MFGRSLSIATLLVGLSAAPAMADITGFIGTDTTPENRLTSGAAIGLSLLIVGFEFEYSHATQDEPSGSPSLTTGMGNVLLQTPTPIFGLQPYVTAGGGLYHEALGSRSDTSFAVNVGGGVKIVLVGPVRLRVDYRVFKLGSDALYTPSHRVYAGLNLAF